MESGGRAYWRSLEDRADTPEFRQFVEREFPSAMPDFLSPASRRNFLKLMGASLGLAGLSACRWPEEKIVPFAYRPAGRTPGVPLQYATAMELGGVAAGLLVTSYDGRPIKIEGNPLHPSSQGAASAIAQAAILEMYDPDRSQDVVARGAREKTVRTWDDFLAHARALAGELRQRGGAGLHVLSEASASPSLLDMRERLQQQFPAMVWHEYEPVSDDYERAGAKLAFGRAVRTRLSLDRTKVLVCLDADLLLAHPDALRHAREFAAMRRAENFETNRLHMVECAHSLTGSLADVRQAVRTSEIPRVTAWLAAEILKNSPGTPADLLAGIGGERPELVATIARDLLANRGASAVVAGPRQSAEVHALVHVINAALGNAGSTVSYLADADRPDHIESIRTLCDELDRGSVDTLLILGGNPAYDAPCDLDFGRRLARAKNSIRLGLYEDETSQLCGWHVPRAHFLESWGDARAWDGTISLVQPLIAPLYDGKTREELLSIFIDEHPMAGLDIVRRTHAKQSDAEWRRALHEGLVPGSTYELVADLAPKYDAVAAQVRAVGVGLGEERGALEIVFVPDNRVYDGRFANNGWLQELPDPLTRLTWDNAATVAPLTARDLGVENGDVVRIEVGQKAVEAPVFVLPGQAPGSLCLALGSGRRACGRIGDGVGVNAYDIRATSGLHFARARVTRTGGTHALATTQDHHIFDRVGIEERERRVAEIIQEADIDEYRKHPKFAHEGEPPNVALWQSHTYEGHRWAMGIDLSACIGCGACVVACQAENNIPVVGKSEVARGREMHWIRVDRYFSGSPDTPRVSYQPVTCQQCENAPCEQVCPVGATQHSSEGLNDMVYNRCIGTRYCSNNCPYKVRRFNWFNNHKSVSDIEGMMYNPEVTVRSRGVMEKCTFCVQRINAVKIESKNDQRSIADGEITPACAQTCPAQAIVFGDLSDPESRVSRIFEHHRAYALLAELNVKPRIRYLAKITNRGIEQS